MGQRGYITGRIFPIGYPLVADDLAAEVLYNAPLAVMANRNHPFGRFVGVLPSTFLRHRANSTWLRTLSVDLSDSSGPIASITVKTRRSAGAMKLFQAMSRTVAKQFAALR